MTARFGLPEVDFVEVDPDYLEGLAVSKFEELQGITLDANDARRNLFKAFTFIATMILNNINYTGKQNLLAYAVDNYLLHKGEEKNVPILEPKPAETIIRFELNNPEQFTITAPVRFPVNDIFFATEDSVDVTPGTLYVDINAVCEEDGIIGNGYLPGQITNMVDPVPWVSKVYNITKSDGGLDLESDDAYAGRIRDSNESFSTAGPELAYEYFAKSANQGIIDVKVECTDPPIVEIYPLMANGELASNEIKSAILAACSSKSVRPLTDSVVVSDPEVVTYNLDITYYLPQSMSTIQESKEADVNNALQDYIVWQKSKLGRGIEPSELYARLQSEDVGAKRITVEPNEYIPLEDTQVAHEGTINLTFGGFIND